MTRRALVVDDNRALAEDLGEILSGEGYLVQVFDDPLRALAETARFDFDFALLDVRMPKLDGVALHRRLMEAHPHARFVLMTAYAEDDRITQALNAGVRRVLTKPVGLSDLLHSLHDAEPGSGRELLLVEDDPAFGAALSEALQESGYVVRHVRSADAARKASKNNLLASIVDVCLPDGDGTDLAIELCRDAEAPVVLITGYDADIPHRAVSELGGRARLLTKPFSPDALLRALSALREEAP